jgi:L-alanine-DL-glutamate epimerase-like enolase superfamily enzyme
MKVGFGKRGDARLGYEHDREVANVKAMCEAIGPDKTLMMACGTAVVWDVSTAIRRVQALDEYHLTWIEEPLGACDPVGYSALRAKPATLIACGQKAWTARGWERVLATGTCDVVGVDSRQVEGTTGFKKVTDRVLVYPRQVNRDACSSAIGSLPTRRSNPWARDDPREPFCSCKTPESANHRARRNYGLAQR